MILIYWIPWSTHTYPRGRKIESPGVRRLFTITSSYIAFTKCVGPTGCSSSNNKIRTMLMCECTVYIEIASISLTVLIPLGRILNSLHNYTCELYLTIYFVVYTLALRMCALPMSLPYQPLILKLFIWLPTYFIFSFCVMMFWNLK